MASLLLLTLTTALLFASGQCISQSMSCSTVNGKMVCERQSSSGNTAGAFAGSYLGQNGAYQDVSAMTGNTYTGQSRSSRTSLDPLRGFGIPSFQPNFNAGRIPDSRHLIGTGASDATSFNANNGNIGISTSGFSGTSNNNGIPGPAFGGYAVADSSGNNFYGGGNAYGGGYMHGYGNPQGFKPNQVFTGNSNGFNPNNVFSSVGLPNPFNMLGRKR